MTVPEETSDAQHNGGKPSKLRRYLTRSVIVAAYSLTAIFILFLGTSLDRHHHPGSRAGSDIGQVDTGNLKGKKLGQGDAAAAGNNTIVFQVDDNGGLTLAPLPGDTIYWDSVDWTQRTTKSLKVKFLDKQSPCMSDPSSSGICIVTNAINNGHFRYDCISQDGTPVNCVDPALGPRSSSEPTHIMDTDIDEFFYDIDDFALKLLGQSKPPVFNFGPQGNLSVSSGSKTHRESNQTFKPFTIYPGDVTVKYAQVTCKSGVTTIMSPDFPDGSDPTLSVKPVDTIEWSSTSSPSTNPTSLQFNASTTPNQITFGQSGPSCPVSQSKHLYNTWSCPVPQGAQPSAGTPTTYTVTDNDCTTTPVATGSIKVTAP